MSNDITQRIQHPFPPLFNAQSHILILGSFPSVKSREQNFFYGHPQNRFWRVVSAVLQQDTPQTVDEKRAFLLQNHIALWDVIASCEIVGSSDSSIRNAVPNDLTNEGRALKVLAAAGVITLKDNDNFNPTLDDIDSNPKNITIQELAANTIPSALPDVTAAVVNGNYALDFGLKTEDAVYKDSVLDEQKYWNLIAAKTDDLSNPRLVAAYDKVIKAFQSDETKKVFNDTYGGYFINVGWDQDLLAQYK
jgi:hypoxanthine-DNA glycosylase